MIFGAFGVCERGVPHPLPHPLPQELGKQGKKPLAIFYDTKKHVKITTKYSLKSLKNPLPFCR